MTMKKLLEAIDQFAGEPEQKPGDQVRSTDKPAGDDKFLGKVHRQHPFKDRLVGESDHEEYKDSYEDEEETDLESGCYVTDKEDHSGEVFKMSGSPDDRRVWIGDKQGRGWNIMPWRLVRVYDEREIAKWFGSDDEENQYDESADDSNLVEELKAAFEDYVSNDKYDNEKLFPKAIKKPPRADKSKSPVAKKPIDPNNLSEENITESYGSSLKAEAMKFKRSGSMKYYHKTMIKYCEHMEDAMMFNASSGGFATSQSYKKQAAKFAKQAEKHWQALDALDMQKQTNIDPNVLTDGELNESYQVGDKVLTQVGGKWIPAVITKLANAAGNYGVKFKVGLKTMNYVSSPAQIKKQSVDEAFGQSEPDKPSKGLSDKERVKRLRARNTPAKKPYPNKWDDVDPVLGAKIDKMSQDEKIKKGWAQKKKEVKEAFATPPPFKAMAAQGGGDIEVGDQIRTRKMSMIGKVVKIEPERSWNSMAVYFRVEDGRLMRTPMSNCVKMSSGPVEEGGQTTRWEVTYWVEPKTYGDEPSREYEDTATVSAASAEEAVKKVSARVSRGYGFKASPSRGEVDEAVSYDQKHSSWSVMSPKKNEFNTPYSLEKGDEAQEHAKRIGGKLVKVDQHGHVIKSKKTTEASKGPSKEQSRANDEEWSRVTAHWKKVHGKDVQMPGGPAGEQKMRQRAVQDGVVDEGKSENRQLWDKINSKGTVPSIDREKYTDLSHEGLEGPFRQKNGQVLYYDPREGKYYDRRTDMYLSQQDYDAMNENCGGGRKAKLESLKARFTEVQGKLKEARKALRGKSLKEAPLNQVVAPATTAQQPPAPAGTQTAAPAPGQQTPPAAGQAGGAPVAPPAGTPQPTPGNNNAATTPLQSVQTAISQLAQNPAAAKQAAQKFANIK